MRTSILSVKVLLFAAYVLAMLVPSLTMAGAQTPAEHARLMAMAGHQMTMTDMGSSASDSAQMLLCQQHCLVAVATLPVAERAADVIEQAAVIATGGDFLAASVVFAPPRHPPKVSRI